MQKLITKRDIGRAFWDAKARVVAGEVGEDRDQWMEIARNEAGHETGRGFDFVILREFEADIQRGEY